MHLAKFYQCFCGDRVFLSVFLCATRFAASCIEVTKEFLVGSSSPLISCAHFIPYTAFDTGCSGEPLFNKYVKYNATCTGCAGKALCPCTVMKRSHLLKALKYDITVLPLLQFTKGLHIFGKRLNK